MKSGMILLILALTPVAVALIAAVAVCSPLIIIYLMFTKTLDFIEDKAKRKARVLKPTIQKKEQPNYFLELIKAKENVKQAI